MMKTQKILVVVLLVALIILGGYYFVQKGKAATTPIAPATDPAKDAAAKAYELGQIAAKEKRDAAEKAAKKADQEKHVLAAMTLGLSRLFNLKF